MKYKANTGLNFMVDGKNRRVEAGEEASDIPSQSVPWLLEQGLIEKVQEKAAEPKPDKE